MTIWFTADTHLGHKNIINFCGRPFLTKEEHDDTIINNWNSVVSRGDHVYHLGDVAFGSSEDCLKFLGRLKGNIHLVKGNHDKDCVRAPCASRFVFIKDNHTIRTKFEDEPIEIYLSHYPHKAWPKSHLGAFHLFGHTHSRLIGDGLSFDVGVDANNFMPISLSEVVRRMKILKLTWDPEITR